MAITISGQNNNDKILASDGVLDQISGFNIVGVLTASTFECTGEITANHIDVGSTIQLGNAGIITATTLIGNVTGNVNSTSNLLLQISGSEKFRVGNNGQLGIAGANYGTSGQVLTSAGSGSAPSWTTITGTTINNNADNRIITGTNSVKTLQGEANLTFDGSVFGIGNSTPKLQMNDGSGRIVELIGGSTSTGPELRTAYAGDLRFGTNSIERLRIESAGTLKGTHPFIFGGFGSVGGTQGCRITGGTGSHPACLSLDGGSSPTLEIGSKSGETIIGTNSYGSSPMNFKTGMGIGTLAGGTTRMSISSGGSVTIGDTATHTFSAHSEGDDLVVGGAGWRGLTIYGEGGGGVIQFADNGDNRRGQILYNHGDDSMLFRTGGNQTRLQIDSSGRIIKPLQPGFGASNMNGFTNLSGSTYAVTSYGTVHHNYGNHFSSSNGRFTAPVDGRYLMHAIGMAVNNSAPHIAFGINNSSNGGGPSRGGTDYGNNNMWSHPSNSGYWVCITHILDLSANDYVRVYTYDWNSSNDPVRCYFYGYLLG